ncbi:Cell division and transport-associated protein TolQ [Humidesulfovibrio mexicanus]|uniref:Cell division and transport-associated protein TolQ n=1 Tax=Humidesulfovibrio mexicanus TaxID=147047 RepID=A0A239D897_9BACT|nr:MotA/TolQ/ExbB proton channel family protein [Humidesulfovibrio mexicanus]SNS28595.1 Cell division and transport-associated protein TolQ [Humidesulfovibrio mexicanus]
MLSEILPLLSKATLVAQVILAFLVCMSLVSWAIMIAKWRELTRAKRDMEGGVATLLSSAPLPDAMRAINQARLPMTRRMTVLWIREYDRLARNNEFEHLLADNMRRVLRHGVAEELRGMARLLPILATTANTAPFIGLFGTVWGIMHSFHAIGQMKTAALATVAPGISEALIATAVGLAVAIPATAGYNIFQGMLGSLEGQCVSFAGLFLNRLREEGSASGPCAESSASTAQPKVSLRTAVAGQ